MKSLIIIFLSSFCFGEVFAADDITFNVPRSELPLSTYETLKVQNLKYLGFEVSTWEPDHLYQDSRLPLTSQFEKSGRSKIALNYSSVLMQTDFGLFSTKFGLSYIQLDRHGYLKIESASLLVTQETNLYQTLAGIEWTSNREFFAHSKPYIDLAISPTWIQSTKSEFNSGVSEWQWAALMAIGVQFEAKPFGQWLGFDNMAFNLSAERTQDLYNDSLTGTGLVLGTKIGWY